MVNNDVKILYYLSLGHRDWDHLHNLDRDGLLSYYVGLVNSMGLGVADNQKIMKHISKQLESVQ